MLGPESSPDDLWVPRELLAVLVCGPSVDRPAQLRNAGVALDALGAQRGPEVAAGQITSE